MGAVLADYERASMYSALSALGRMYLRTLSSVEASKAFAIALGDDAGTTATQFKRWYAYQVASRSGSNVTDELLDDIQKLEVTHELIGVRGSSDVGFGPCNMFTYAAGNVDNCNEGTVCSLCDASGASCAPACSMQVLKNNGLGAPRFALPSEGLTVRDAMMMLATLR